MARHDEESECSTFLPKIKLIFDFVKYFENPTSKLLAPNVTNSDKRSIKENLKWPNSFLPPACRTHRV